MIFSPGDWNMDGRPDVIVRNAAGDLNLFRGNGKGTWLNGTAPNKIGTGWNAYSFVL